MNYFYNFFLKALFSFNFLQFRAAMRYQFHQSKNYLHVELSFIQNYCQYFNQYLNLILKNFGQLNYLKFISFGIQQILFSYIQHLKQLGTVLIFLIFLLVIQEDSFMINCHNIYPIDLYMFQFLKYHMYLILNQEMKHLNLR
ncbi:transmembrane protein, putative (macronuclear) [Tetrahymena thermophila SB210]|uniref:Transmembrane protein, putative n=1 Tax=Tetrahymena thermophila (strain SB210) TaxID=312017 RepID=W7XGZ3_TETTS|nr:transmembrane protein, putative [Tetrahymena thermophila SB210]EWS76348.1 transmembrane protein, putative [Tetrahymena thermophila SB210]|eukprot:XP_012651132.1 transmembrane protein, putative [Tetrahymena thermophila SB210]